jgi:4-hydroxyproline epimerase
MSDHDADVVTAIDAHVAGNVLRLVTAGAALPAGRTPADLTRWLKRRDGIRLMALLREPRGHDGQQLGLLAAPSVADADAALIVLSSPGVVPISGCGLIAAVTIALERRLLLPRQDGLVRIQTGIGTIETSVTADADGRVTGVRYVGPPSFVFAGGVPLPFGSRGIRVDVAWSGQFFAIVDTETAGLSMDVQHHAEFRAAARAIAASVDGTVTLSHPSRRTNETLAGVVFTGPATSGSAQLRIVPASANGELFRGPSAEALGALLAVLDAMGLATDEELVVEGLTGPTLSGRIDGRSRAGDIDAIHPRVSARAWIVADHEFRSSERDPLRDGFDW